MIDSQENIGFIDFMFYLNRLPIPKSHKHRLHEMAGEKRKRGEKNFYDLAIIAENILSNVANPYHEQG